MAAMAEYYCFLYAFSVRLPSGHTKQSTARSPLFSEPYRLAISICPCLASNNVLTLPSLTASAPIELIYSHVCHKHVWAPNPNLRPSVSGNRFASIIYNTAKNSRSFAQTLYHTSTTAFHYLVIVSSSPTNSPSRDHGFLPF